MSGASDTRIAVAGCGYWGKNLIRNFASLADLRLCCDTSEQVLARVARDYPGVPLTDSYAEVLASPDVDAVVLATPAPQHADMAVAALEAGKHVFVEKPLALSVADAERVVRVAESSDRIVMVGHLLEYHPAVVALKEMLDRGDLGEIYYCYSQRVNLGKVRSDENALWSLAPHDIAVMLYLMEEEPVDVQASGQAFIQPGIEDVAFLTLRFGSGRVAHIQVSWLDPHKERRLTIVGSEKMVVFDDMQPREKLKVYDKGVHRGLGEAPDYDDFGDLLTLREGDILLPRVPNGEPLAVECAEFLRAIETGVPPRSDVYDGLRVVRVLEAAQRSLRDEALAYPSSSASGAHG